MKKLKISLFILLAVPLFTLITIAEIIALELKRIVVESKIKQIAVENYVNSKEIYDKFVNRDL